LVLKSCFSRLYLDLPGKIRLSQDWSVQVGKNSENSLSAYAIREEVPGGFVTKHIALNGSIPRRLGGLKYEFMTDCFNLFTGNTESQNSLQIFL